MKETS
ncbi:UNVERIFIED_CONTAM: hypothetical protein GTU68_002755 [Idotea baltica]|jgi:KH domain-containing, RNA-binding, signal transduction-associated protein 3